MKWFKVDVNELLFPDVDNDELLERFRVRALCAQYEGLPPKHLIKKDSRISADHELAFIQPDINAVISHRKSVQLQYKKQTDSKTDNQSDSKTDGADKIRLDKTKQDKIRLDEVKEKVMKKFVPPTIDEVRAYTVENNIPVSPWDFIRYFEAGGWKDAKGNQVKNWKQKILTWAKYEPAKKEEQGRYRR